MHSLLDRIQEFIDWLEADTDFHNWDQSVKDEVHRALIVYMISGPTDDSYKEAIKRSD